MGRKFRVSFTMSQAEGGAEMYMVVNADDENSAIQLVKESVPYRVSVTSVELEKS